MLVCVGKDDVNKETGVEAVKAQRLVSFVVRDYQFQVNVILPLYVKEALSGGDWERSIDATVKKAEELILENACLGEIVPSIGTLKRIQDYVSRYLVQGLYERFLDHQERAGNPAWEVPETEFTDLDREISGVLQ